MSSESASEIRFREHLGGAEADARTREILRRRGVAPARRRGRLVRRALVASDAAGLSLAFLVALLVFQGQIGPTNPVSVETEILLFLATVPGWVLLAQLHGLYDRDEERPSHSTIDDVAGVFQLVTVGAWLFFGASWLIGIADPYPPKLITFWAVAIAFIVLARAGARTICRRTLTYVQNTLIVGADPVGRLVARKLTDHPEFGVNLVGFVDHANDPDLSHGSGLRVLGTPAELPALVRAYDVERILVAACDSSSFELENVIRSVRDLNVQVDIVPRLYGQVNPNAEIYTVEGFPMLALPSSRPTSLALLLKRVLDVMVAGVALVAAAPLMLLIALRLKTDSPGPVFYRHQRVGLGGRPFHVFKFRTMFVDDSGAGGGTAPPLEGLLADPAVREEFAQTYKLVSDPRVTRFGRVLRRYSLDELPQLLNVLLGTMSIVGPRPVTQDELDRYGDGVATLLSFRPGLTGYWQINGRSRTHYDERVRLDLTYIRGWSLKLDLTILGKTLQILLKGHGAY